MYVRIDLNDFREAFNRMGRGDNFTYAGLGELFEYLEELEHCEEQTELDVIGLCCDFAEGTAQEIASSYNVDIEGMDDEAARDEVVDMLDAEGFLVGETDTTIVYRQF